MDRFIDRSAAADETQAANIVCYVASPAGLMENCQHSGKGGIQTAALHLFTRGNT